MSSNLTIGIDYLQGMARFDSFKKFEKFVKGFDEQMITGDEYYFSNEAIMIGRRFTNRVKSIKGLYGAFSYEEDYIDAHLQLTGTICRELIKPVEFLKYFKDNITKTTRIDIAIDDYKRRITQRTLARLAERGHYKGLPSFKIIESKLDKDDKPIGTCVFGKSEKILKFYNAEFVHQIPADRWELLLRGDYAEFCSDEIIKQEDVRAAGKFLTGAVDFIRPGENWYQDKRYQFWQDILDELGQAKLRKEADEPTLERALAWIDNQVAPTLSVLYHGLGEKAYQEYMAGTATEAVTRLKDYHLAWITYLQEKQEKISL